MLGFVELLGWSAPSPSSPNSKRKKAFRTSTATGLRPREWLTVCSVLSPTNDYRVVIVVRGDTPVGDSPGRDECHLAPPVIVESY